MIQTQLSPPLPVLTEQGEGDAYICTNYGLDYDAEFMVVLRSGPIIWLPTNRCRRAPNWTRGFDPGGKVGKKIKAARSR